MIGKIIFTLEGESHEAILHADGRWTATLDLAQLMLNRAFRTPRPGDSQDKMMNAELQKAALALQGQIVTKAAQKQRSVGAKGKC